MEAINRNDSFVPSLYAKPHPKCPYNNTVHTHTFPPALICAELTLQSRGSVGSLEWHQQTVTYWQPLHTAEITCDAAVSWPHTGRGGEQNWTPLFPNIMCVFDWLSPFYTTLSLRFTRSIRFFPCSHESGYLETACRCVVSSRPRTTTLLGYVQHATSNETVW